MRSTSLAHSKRHTQRRSTRFNGITRYIMRFRIQSTPNPNARKYITSESVKMTGKVSYKSLEECQHVPLAAAVLSIPGVSQVHLFENVVTVTQTGEIDWAQLDTAVQNIVREQISGHNPEFVEQLNQPKEKIILSPELQIIDQILEDTIRPGLQMDGGDIEVLELDSNILTVRYMGACGGCPSSMAGTLEAIRHIIRTEYQEDIEVVAV